MIQVNKVWWDGEKLMAEPIDPATIYQEPAQQPRYDLLHEYAVTNRLDYNNLCRVVRAATEQPAQQQEPVGRVDEISTPFGKKLNPVLEVATPVGAKLYTSPQLKPWVGIDAGDWNKIAYTSEFRAGADWAEAKLREKNHG